MGVLRNAEATSDTPRLHLWIWLMRSMILSVVACGVWAYLDSLSMIWVYPFPRNLALSWPDLGPITHLDSMIFAWSSLDSRLRGTGSYTSWPILLNEMSSFLIASLTSFSEYPWRSPWYRLEVWDPEAIEVLDLLLFDRYWLSIHWSPRFLAWVTWSCWFRTLKVVAFRWVALWVVEVVQEDLIVLEDEVFLDLNNSLPRLKELKTLPELKIPEENPENEWPWSRSLKTQKWPDSFVEARTCEQYPWRASDHKNLPCEQHLIHERQSWTSWTLQTWTGLLLWDVW